VRCMLLSVLLHNWESSSTSKIHSTPLPFFPGRACSLSVPAFRTLTYTKTPTLLFALLIFLLRHRLLCTPLCTYCYYLHSITTPQPCTRLSSSLLLLLLLPRLLPRPQGMLFRKILRVEIRPHEVAWVVGLLRPSLKSLLPYALLWTAPTPFSLLMDKWGGVGPIAVVVSS
jgi:hypothetical protein